MVVELMVVLHYVTYGVALHYVTSILVFLYCNLFIYLFIHFLALISHLILV